MKKENFYYTIFLFIIVLILLSGIFFYFKISQINQEITLLRSSNVLNASPQIECKDYEENISNLIMDNAELKKSLLELKSNINENKIEFNKYVNTSRESIVGGGVSGSGSICESWGEAKCSSGSGIICPEGYDKFQMRFLISLDEYRSVHFCVIKG